MNTAQVEYTEKQLHDYGIPIEPYGGHIPVIHISAKEKLNLEELTESILLQTEVMELKADHDCLAQGCVIEARKGKNGTVCTLLLQKGKLNLKDYVVAGNCSGKVRKMTDDYGRDVKQALPSDAVEV